MNYLLIKKRSRNSSANHGRPVKFESKNAGKSHRNKNLTRKTGKTAKNYEDEEWRTVYIGFVERGTSSEDLAKVFKVSCNFSGIQIQNIKKIPYRILARSKGSL